jgi:hypothetical protein
MIDLSVGANIILIPRTKYGKERMKRFGNLWRVVEVRNIMVHCCNGPAVRIESFVGNDCRWLCRPVDRDFDIEGDTDGV